VVALYPQIVEDALKQLRSDKNILQNPEFLAARKRVNATGPFVYVNGPEAVKNTYPLVLLFVNAISAFGESSFSGEMMPSYQRVLTCVGHDALTLSATEDGIAQTRTIGNPLLSPLTLDSPAMLLLAAMPDLLGNPSQRDQMTSANILRQIGQRVLAYAGEHDKKMPADLKELHLQPVLLDSPFGDAPSGDIVYLRYENMKLNPSAEIVIGYDAAALQEEDATNVLFEDGHVDWMDRTAFEKALTRSREVDPKMPRVQLGQLPGSWGK
jgi:hypothetical protein